MKPGTIRKPGLGRTFGALLLIMALLSLCACGTTAPAGSATPTPTAATASDTATPTATEPTAVRAVADLMGRTMTMPSEVNTVVSLTPVNTEIVFALGMQDKLVGVDMYSDYPPEVADIAKIGDYSAPSAEMIVALNPDLVLAGDKLQADIIAQLEDLGLVVLATESGTLEGIEDSINLVGEALGAPDQAEALIGQMHEQRDRVVSAVAAVDDKPSVYYVMSFGEYGNWTSGPGTFINTIIELAGGTCITQDGGALWMDYSMEDLIARDPDILLMAADAGTVDSLAASAGFQDLPAVQQGLVYPVDANMLSRPGPRIYEALEMVAGILHPDLVQ